MDVRPAHAERADPCPARRVGRWPGFELLLNVERSFSERDLRIRRRKVQARWQFAVPQHQGGLDQPGDARGGGYPGGVIVVGGERGGAHMVTYIDPSKVTLEPFGYSPTE